MSVSKLLKSFAARHFAPVEVSEVLKEVRALGVQDEIKFFRDVDLDSGVLHGFLHRTKKDEEGSVSYRSVITYGKMGHERERLISCKELVHILDPKAHRVGTKEQVAHLVSKIVLPLELQDPFSDGEKVWNDRVAILEALALLFPLQARENLYAKYMAHQLTIPQIAERMELPPEYVATVMNGNWPGCFRSLVSRRERIEEALRPKPRARKLRDITLPRKRKP